MPVSALSRFAHEIDADGAFRRQGNRFTDRVTADGTSVFPVTPGRYQLIASPGCPWSHSAIITRRLLGLEDVIGLSEVEFADNGGGGWRFTAADGHDPATGLTSLTEAYLATDPDYRNRVTVPVLYDRTTRRVVSNDFHRIPLDFCTAWSEFHAPGAPRLYPRALRARLDAFSALAHTDVCDGVYRCGLARSREAYEEAFQRLFERLDWFAMMLSQQRFLLGDRITIVDIRMFATLVRFDVVYHDLFRCDRNELTEMSVLWAYARDLFQTPGFGDTVDFRKIEDHYARCHGTTGATGPPGPGRARWLAPAERESLTAPGA